MLRCEGVAVILCFFFFLLALGDAFVHKPGFATTKTVTTERQQRISFVPTTRYEVNGDGDDNNNNDDIDIDVNKIMAGPDNSTAGDDGYDPYGGYYRIGFQFNIRIS